MAHSGSGTRDAKQSLNWCQDPQGGNAENEKQKHQTPVGKLHFRRDNVNKHIGKHQVRKLTLWSSLGFLLGSPEVFRMLLAPFEECFSKIFVTFLLSLLSSTLTLLGAFRSPLSLQVYIPESACSCRQLEVVSIGFPLGKEQRGRVREGEKDYQLRGRPSDRKSTRLNSSHT